MASNFKERAYYEKRIGELEDRLDVLSHRGIRRVTRDELYRHNVAFWDIEATGLRASFDRLLCVGIKPLGEPAVVIRLDDFDLYKTEAWNDSKLAEISRDVLSHFTYLIGYNSIRYDLRFLNSRLAKYSMDLLDSSVAHVDVLQTMRKRFRLASNRLEAVLTFFKTKSKKTPLSPEQWAMGQCGSVEAMNYIVKHNQMDLVTLEELVMKKLPKDLGLNYAYVR